MQVPRPDRERGVYGISVAAELVGMGMQNLRLYEARGLLEPDRTDGGTRRYSADDLDRLRRIGDLLEAGLNLAGIGMVLDLEAQNTELLAAKQEQQSAQGRLDPSEQVPAANLRHRQARVDPSSLTDPYRRGRKEPAAATRPARRQPPMWDWCGVRLVRPSWTACRSLSRLALSAAHPHDRH